MKKILMFTNAKCGGAERVTITFSKILHDAGYDVTLLLYRALEKKDYCELSSFIPEYIKTEYVYGRFRTLLWKLRSYLKGSGHAIVFTSLPLLNYLNIILSKFILRERVAVIRECNTPSRHPKYIRFLNRILYRFADILISQTDEMRDEMADLYWISPDRIITVYNPVDVAQIDASINEKWDVPFDVKKYVAIGRVQPQKDYSTLLRAFAELLIYQPKSLLYVIGDDTSEYAALQKSLAVELGVADKVFFMGFQSNPYKYLNNSDCFVLSSEYEGLPNVMLEALYLGVPIVATESIPFVSKMLSDGKYGICVPIGNSCLLAQAMLKATSIKRYDSHNVAAATFASFMNVLNFKVLR